MKKVERLLPTQMLLTGCSVIKLRGESEPLETSWLRVCRLRLRIVNLGQVISLQFLVVMVHDAHAADVLWG